MTGSTIPPSLAAIRQAAKLARELDKLGAESLDISGVVWRNRDTDGLEWLKIIIIHFLGAVQ